MASPENFKKRYVMCDVKIQYNRMHLSCKSLTGKSGVFEFLCQMDEMKVCLANDVTLPQKHLWILAVNSVFVWDLKSCQGFHVLIYMQLLFYGKN